MRVKFREYILGLGLCLDPQLLSDSQLTDVARSKITHNVSMATVSKCVRFGNN